MPLAWKQKRPLKYPVNEIWNYDYDCQELFLSITIYLGKFRGFADKFPKWPRIKHVNWSGERDREEDNEQVAQRQIEDKYVGQVAHGFVTTNDEHETAVANYPRHEDEAEENRYDVWLHKW